MHIVEGEHRVDLRLMSDVVRLGLFGNAGADENYLRIVPVGFFEQAAVRDHGADDRGQIGDQLGVIFLHQSLTVGQQVVMIFSISCALMSLWYSAVT